MPMSGEGAWGQILLLVAMFAVFYLLLIRPQQKRMKEHRARIAAMRRGDTVVTGGGVIGKVVKVESGEEAIIEIADNVRVRVVSSTISDVRAKGEPVKEAAPAAKPANDAD
jgi:preprotein translocase subunit YajC